MNKNKAPGKDPSFAELVDHFPPPRPPPQSRPQRLIPAVSLRDSPSPQAAPEMFFRPGVPRRRVDALRRQRSWPPKDQIDLHGASRAEARRQLEAFFSAALARRCSAVQIVHGKGLHSREEPGVLRAQVRAWLQSSPLVLGWCAAPAPAGGDGCTRVLLKSPRRAGGAQNRYST